MASKDGVDSSTTTTNSSKIVILGAGVAGLAAASRLLQNGFQNVTILEAQDRIGGRVHTMPLGNSVIEMGAQWIHGEVGNPIFEIAKVNDLILETPDDDIVTALDAEFRTQEGEKLNQHLARDFEIIMCSIMEEAKELAKSPEKFNLPKSALSFFQRKFAEYLKSLTDLPKATQIKDGMFRWYCLFRNTIEGCDSLQEMSIESWSDYQECEGNPVIDLKNGYDKVLDVLLKNIPESCIHLNKPVRAVHLGKTLDGRLMEGKLPVNVICLDGENIQAHHVIVTCSLGYLKRHVNTMFLPAVPELKKQAITTLGFGTVNKIYLEFEKPFWDSESQGYSFVWVDEIPSEGKPAIQIPVKQPMSEIWFKAIIGFYTVPKQPNVLCGWIAGKEARYMESLDDSVVQETCLQVLKQFTNRSSLPRVVKVIRSAWQHNPYHLGSYSYKTQGCDVIKDIINDLMEPIYLKLEDLSIGGTRQHPAILFAGEATHPSYYSTVHGALLSGWREGDRLEVYYNALKEERERELSFAELQEGLVSSHRVIIIGAGIAGLAAAERLLDHGIIDVRILEAQNRPGGRIHTVVFDGSYLELGAQWIHGEDGNSAFDLANLYNLIVKHPQERSYEGEGYFNTQDGVVIETKIVKEVKDIVQQIYDECCSFYEQGMKRKKDIPPSVGHFLHSKFLQYLNKTSDTPKVKNIKWALLDWHNRFSCIDNSCYYLRELSAVTWGEYKDCPGETHINFTAGYESLVSAFIKKFPEDLIIYNKPVQTIAWDTSNLNLSMIYSYDSNVQDILETIQELQMGRGLPESMQSDNLTHAQANRQILGLKQYRRTPDFYSVEIQCEDGDRFYAEQVINTISLGCLKSNYETMFQPPLSDQKQKAIQAFGYGTINKIFLIFEKPFWKPDCKGFQLVWTDKIELPSQEDSPRPWYRDISGFDVLYGYNNILLGWIGRKGAEIMEEISDDEVTAVCVDLLKKFSGIRDIPNPLKMIRSQWKGNRYIQGAYSYRTVAADKEEVMVKDLIEPVYHSFGLDLKFPVLMFAGEATDVMYYSTVHGAINSGERESDRIISIYEILTNKLEIEATRLKEQKQMELELHAKRTSSELVAKKAKEKEKIAKEKEKEKEKEKADTKKHKDKKGKK